jgi:hypothetical protein
MRKLTVVITGTIMLAMLAGVAGATHSPGKGPKQDMANGTLHATIDDGTGQTADVQLHINAKSGPLGEDAQGQMWIRVATPTQDIELRARVSCLNVVGNLATAAGLIERGGEAFPGMQTLVISVQDFGEPGGSGATPDTFNAQTLMGPPPATCPVLPTILPATGGNVIVHDAQ